MSEPSLVLCVRCPELHGPFAALDIATHPIQRASELRTADDDLSPRAIVLGPASIRDIDVTHEIPRLRQAWPLVDVLLWHPRATAALVRRALQAGARDVLLTRSPEAACRAIEVVIDQQQLLPRQEARPSSDTGFEGMLARSRSMFDLFETASQVAQSNAAVLILGETGTGKELLARAIHKRSRRPGRFVALNCGAVPETLIDSELFGHIEGAFTGATKPKPGLFRHADTGTLLLDEAGNVPLPVQYRLLRVLQEGAVRPVGAHNEVPVDVRVLAATSASLEEDVLAGRFREDLFYRLDVIRLVIPPLRERPDDIIFLFARFARRFSDSYRVARPDVTDGFLDALVEHPWPGNVRQLENFTERLVLTEHDHRVTAARFHELVAFQGGASGASVGSTSRKPRLHGAEGALGGHSHEPAALDLHKPMNDALKPHVEELERRYIEGLLSENDGRVVQTAKAAGVSRRTMTRLLKRLDIDKDAFR